MPFDAVLVGDMYANLKDVVDSGIMSGYRANDTDNMGGKFVRQLEQDFCDKFEIRHAIAVSSATTALHTALLACNLLDNTTVTTTPMSFSASASCIQMADMRTRFADIDENTYNFKPETKNYIKHDRVILGVHLMGNPLDMDSIITLADIDSLVVIEDASQAIGATYKHKRVGTIGDCGIFSFNQSKPITSGEGGMLVTNSDEIARRARLIRNHGETQDNILGYNYRLTELQAAVLIPQLKLLDAMNAYRRELAEYFTYKLAGIPSILAPKTCDGGVHTYYTYGVRYTGGNRNELQKRLNEAGVYFGNPDYGKPLYLLPGYKHLGLGMGTCPVAERLWAGELMVTDRLRYPTTFRDIDRWTEIIKRTIGSG